MARSTAKITADEAARRLDRNPDLIRRWLIQGRLKGEKFGPVWMIEERELERFRRAEPERRRRDAS